MSTEATNTNGETRFIDFLRARVGSNWVLARRTPSIVARYGADVVCLTQKNYHELEVSFERETGRSASDWRRPSDTIVAAAPDLLATCETALDTIQRALKEGGENPKRACEDLRDVLRQAIGRAKD